MARTLLFAPGAGAPSTSGWMTAWAERLEELGRVVAMDYPYMLAGRKRPDPQPKLIAVHRTELDKISDRPVVLIGKSMGSRIGCHVSLDAKVDALVCFGYPLRSPSGALRDQVLLELTTPILFIQGTKDTKCPLEELDDVRKRMRAPSTVHVVEGGDHSLAISRGKSKREQQAAVDNAILAAVRTHLTHFAPL
ncbi:MAG TPA: alpha/beta family hydrolase [Myxococcota bacterium]|nr:alpha/beta family hydrolase [Myxococcota bacterium]